MAQSRAASAVATPPGSLGLKFYQVIPRGDGTSTLVDNLSLHRGDGVVMHGNGAIIMVNPKDSFRAVAAQAGAKVEEIEPSLGKIGLEHLCR